MVEKSHWILLHSRISTYGYSGGSTCRMTLSTIGSDLPAKCGKATGFAPIPK